MCSQFFLQIAVWNFSHFHLILQPLLCTENALSDTSSAFLLILGARSFYARIRLYVTCAIRYGIFAMCSISNAINNLHISSMLRSIIQTRYTYCHMQYNMDGCCCCCRFFFIFLHLRLSQYLVCVYQTQSSRIEVTGWKSSISQVMCIAAAVAVAIALIHFNLSPILLTGHSHCSFSTCDVLCCVVWH